MFLNASFSFGSGEMLHKSNIPIIALSGCRAIILLATPYCEKEVLIQTRTSSLEMVFEHCSHRCLMTPCERVEVKLKNQNQEYVDESYYSPVQLVSGKD